MTKPSPARNRPNRQRAERAGRWAETLAALYLRLQGFSIVAGRYKTPVGELDLIARRGGLTVFVEVKARQSRSEEMVGLEAVNRQRIVRTAYYYLARNPQIASNDMRFDVIFLAPWSLPRHVKGAFEAD